MSALLASYRIKSTHQTPFLQTDKRAFEDTNGFESPKKMMMSEDTIKAQQDLRDIYYNNEHFQPIELTLESLITMKQPTKQEEKKRKKLEELNVGMEASKLFEKRQQLKKKKTIHFHAENFNISSDNESSGIDKGLRQLQTDEIQKNKMEESKQRAMTKLARQALMVFDHGSLTSRKVKEKTEGLFGQLCQQKIKKGAISSGEATKERRLRILLSVTMYNENAAELDKTIRGIYNNIKYFRAAGVHQDEIALVVLMDGIEKMHTSMARFFEQQDELKNIRMYGNKTMNDRFMIWKYPQEYDIQQVYPADSIYMYQTCFQPGDQSYVTGSKDSMKDNLNVFLAVKLMNGGKLSSHMWFLRGFCEILNPHYTVLIDVGTVPNEDAIYKFFIALECDARIGGICGYLNLYKESIVEEIDVEQEEYEQWMQEEAKKRQEKHEEPTKKELYPLKREQIQYCQLEQKDSQQSTQNNINLNQMSQKRRRVRYERADKRFYDNYDCLTKFMLKFFCIQKSQIFEYCSSNIQSKSFESLIGFINVLPGSFSGYRWDALRSRHDDPSNMLDTEYLKSARDPNFQQSDDYNIISANMQLAEDRILCLEIYARKNYVLKYLPSSVAYCDPVKHLVGLMGQRRRWQNGSLFAFIHVFIQVWNGKLKQSTHSSWDKIKFWFLLIINIIQICAMYFSLCLQFIIFFIALKSVFMEIFTPVYLSTAQSNLCVVTLSLSYLTMLIVIIAASLKHSPKDMYRTFSFASTVLGILTMFTLATYVYFMLRVFVFDKYYIQYEGFELIQENRKQIMFILIFNLMGLWLPIISHSIVNNRIGILLDVMLTFKDFMFYLPTYMLTIMIYSFCNMDDLSWGTKNLMESNIKSQRKKNEFQRFKVQYVVFWVCLNVMLTVFFMYITSTRLYASYFILIVAYSYTGKILIQALCAVFNDIIFWFESHFKFVRVVKEHKKEYEEEIVHEKDSVFQSPSQMRINVGQPSLLSRFGIGKKNKIQQDSDKSDEIHQDLTKLDKMGIDERQNDLNIQQKAPIISNSKIKNVLQIPKNPIAQNIMKKQQQLSNQLIKKSFPKDLSKPKININKQTKPLKKETQQSLKNSQFQKQK